MFHIIILRLASRNCLHAFCRSRRCSRKTLRSCRGIYIITVPHFIKTFISFPASLLHSTVIFTSCISMSSDLLLITLYTCWKETFANHKQANLYHDQEVSRLNWTSEFSSHPCFRFVIIGRLLQSGTRNICDVVYLDLRSTERCIQLWTVSVYIIVCSCNYRHERQLSANRSCLTGSEA